MALNFVTFNQDYSLLAVGTSRGFRLYSTDPFSKVFETFDGDVSILEMLFSTSLVALILSPRLLRIQNTKRQSTICELTFPTMILAVRLNRKRLVVVLEDQIYLYDISNMNLLATIESAPNLHAICALSPSSDNNYLAYPVSKKVASPTYELPPHAPPNANRPAPTSGDVMLYDATKLEQVNIIEAHATPLSHIALNNDGTLLSTASEKGTIIRVFSVPDAQKLYQFRRGSMPSRIYSMSFNTTSTLLCVSSATETVHIFRLSSQSARPSSATTASPPTSPSGLRSSRERSLSPSSEDQGESGYLAQSEAANGSRPQKNPTFMSVLRRTSQNIGGSVAAAVGGYMPSAVAEIWEPQRDFAWVKIPKSTSGANSIKTVVAMSSNGPQVMVVTSEGNYFVFNIDLEGGGEGTLVKQYSLLENSGRLGKSAGDD
ncbi:MAG: autophagy protein [Bathelium mastoideum]|nr:MAG: autophagy protein [Bathelium mastoideum]KAI9694118.1 MAG: autophagy protein [Bathelium mastoideum]